MYSNTIDSYLVLICEAENDCFFIQEIQMYINDGLRTKHACEIKH